MSQAILLQIDSTLYPRRPAPLCLPSDVSHATSPTCVYNAMGPIPKTSEEHRNNETFANGVLTFHRRSGCLDY